MAPRRTAERAALLAGALSALLAAPKAACSESPRAHATEHRTARHFERSPSGVLEVDAEWVAAHRGEVRLVDVREEDELREDGHAPDVEWVPLAHLEEVAANWDRAKPVALVCRSGRRSARGAAALDALGFAQVASVTGGMREWTHLGLPVSHGPDVRPLHAEARGPARATARAAGAATAATGADVAGAPGPTGAGIHADGSGAGDVDPPTDDALAGTKIQWVRVASLLFSGVASCIDGRDEHPVIGTPGGDAGELALLLAAAEEVGGTPFSESDVTHLFDAYVDAFGRFYLHSDAHAMERLGASLRADPRFAPHAARLGDAMAVDAFVRHPPHALEEALLEHLVRPEHVGCGHLRLQLEHPAEYHEREGLVAAVLRATFRALWRTPEKVDFVVLTGRHAEASVLVVHSEGEVHPWSWVAAVAPRAQGVSAFVVHPEVTDYLRRENAALLVAETPWLQRHGSRAQALDRARLDEALARLGPLQRDATVARLGAGLPRHDVTPRR